MSNDDRLHTDITVQRVLVSNNDHLLLFPVRSGHQQGTTAAGSALRPLRTVALAARACRLVDVWTRCPCTWVRCYLVSSVLFGGLLGDSTLACLPANNKLFRPTLCGRRVWSNVAL